LEVPVSDADHTPLDARARDAFRLQAKYMFFTWPQCTTPKEVVLAKLKAMPTFDYAVVSCENHNDTAGVHLHAFVAWTKQSNKIGAKWIDAFAGKHGNYQAARNNLKVVQYVIKDGSYVSDGFDPALYISQQLNKKSTAVSRGDPSKTKAFQVAEKLASGDTLDDIDTFDPGYVLQNKRKIEDYAAWHRTKRMALAKLQWPGVDLTDVDTSTANYTIAKWILDNIKQPREFKQKQLYIWSRFPDAGKTHLVRELTKYLSVFHLPKTKFVCGYESGRFDLVVCDEFNADFTMQFLNEFVQGSDMFLNQKGAGTIKHDNPPVIILSNKSPEGCYWKSCHSEVFTALMARFIVVEIPEGEKIDVFRTLEKV